ncbi:MAG TPA: LacI family DNA-binding transcriptional regulator [Kineosporiaceae bacterium]|nr:LacI family DNA-binding transcriptional regulator [Kineosporiaceae bacterium]
MSRIGRPTLADVARLAGVSLKTASRAMNGEYGVAEGTADRVLAAARELGFRPNRLARSLAAGGASAAVGLVLPAVSDPFMAAVAGAVEMVLAPRDLQLLSASHNNDPQRERQIMRTFVERRLDALITIPAPGDASYLRRDIDHGLIIVAVDRPLRGVDVDTVVVDNRAGAAEAVSRLVTRGHRRIAALGNDSRLWTLQQRLCGYRDGLARAGLAYDPALVHLDCVDEAGAERAVRTMAKLADPPTAAFAAQHLAGRGVIRAMRSLDLPVEVAAFDELIDVDLLARPPLIVVASGPDRLGSLAAQRVIERLDGSHAAPELIVLTPLYIEQGEAHRTGSADPLPAVAG